MLQAKIARQSIPSARTVRRMEDTGRKPHIRHAFGVAQFYGVEVAQLWPVRERVLV